MRVYIYSIIAILLLVGFAQSATLTVCHIGCEYSRIQAAIDASGPDDVIEICSGYYTESVIYSHNVTLKGVDTGSGKPTLAGSIDTNGNPFSASYLIVTGPIVFVKDIIINGLYDTQILGGMNTR